MILWRFTLNQEAVRGVELKRGYKLGTSTADHCLKVSVSVYSRSNHSTTET